MKEKRELAAEKRKVRNRTAKVPITPPAKVNLLPREPVAPQYFIPDYVLRQLCMLPGNKDADRTFFTDSTPYNVYIWSLMPESVKNSSYERLNQVETDTGPG
jgi:hypothetical protein